MNCIIIDDEATARVIINQLCSEIKDINIVGEFANAMQAIKYLNQNEVDLIFLDIHMPDFTGLPFKKLKANQKNQKKRQLIIKLKPLQVTIYI